MRRIEMTGQKYGRLTVLAELSGNRLLAVCDCGVEKHYTRGNVLAGYTQSCGCYRDRQTRLANTKHSYCGTDTYVSWQAMKARCDNPAKDSYHRYGGRGITYDPRWAEFTNFLADMGERPLNKELDRIDNNGHYQQSNCRWVAHQVNCTNKG